MVEFEVHINNKKIDLLKPIEFLLKVTSISNKNIEIAKEIFEVEIFENKKMANGCTHFRDEDELVYVTLKPNESIEIKYTEKHYLTFQYLYKNRKQIEKFTLSLNVKFFIKGLPYGNTEFIAQKNTIEPSIDYTTVEHLLTPSKEPSKYIKYKGNIIYISEYSRAYEKPSKKLNIDMNSIKVLDRSYIVDKEKVFKDGNLQRVSSKEFKIFNQLFAGNHEKILTTYGDAKVKDPKTFEVFNAYEGVGRYKKGYARDKYHLYFFNEGSSTTHATICRACKNSSSFKELYTKDENSEIYGICERTVYINGVSISMADAKTWEDLGMYSKDKKNVFYFTYKVNGADINTFETIKDPEAGIFCSLTNKIEYSTLEESRWGRDKNNYYDCGKQSSKAEYLEQKQKYEKR